jgi:type IV pilus assembly protein PilE
MTLRLLTATSRAGARCALSDGQRASCEFGGRAGWTTSESIARVGQASGFTLIELMVVMGIVAILAAIAFPSYQAYVRRSNRAAAEAFLMDIGTRQQQYFLDVRSYADSVATLGMSTPTEVTQYYTITVTRTPGPPPGYTLTATPQGMQARDSSCAPLSVDQGGAKLPAGCW